MLVRNIIRDLKARGTTVFLNSHLLGEVEATCDRVAFIKTGRVIQTMRLDEGHTQITVEFRAAGVSADLLAALENMTGHAVRQAAPVPPGVNGSYPQHYELQLTDEALLPQIAQQALQCGAQLYALTPRRMSLEERFLEIVGKEDSGQ
ncbi:MAG: hypothetical protein HC893_00430 [Chloroflexaceae bacterium]|nr:hypothetical protein [Chloroflexaceae bacterium]